MTVIFIDYAYLPVNIRYLCSECQVYKRDFYVIATQSTPEQKEETQLSLIGVYMEAGYYAINYDTQQHYRFC